MKRAIVNELTQMNDKLQGHVYMMYYGYMNLCIKAEPAALLPVKVKIDNEIRNIEDVASVAKQEGEDYQLAVIPKTEEDIIDIAKGIATSHPEFKQERKTLDIEMHDGTHRDVPYLLLVMPEVDNNRYDLLKNMVNMFYDDCKAKMELVFAVSGAKIANLTAGEAPDKIDEIKKAMKDQHEMWEKHRDKLHDDKLKEIEEGHERWLTEKAESKQRESDDDSGVVTSMRMN